MTEELAGAVAQGQLRLHYQPQLNANDGTVLGFEALARWRSPVLGEIAPDIFISLAEETGLIHEIGHWVLTQALSDFAPLQNGRKIKIAVNISRFQLKHPGFADFVAAELARTDFAPDCLELEITESTGLTDDPVVAASIATLRQMGIALALDDFGTGYSNLATLGKFRFTCLKLDRSLLQALLDTDHGRKVITSTVEFGKSLGLQTVAEGIESEAHAEFLRQIGCDYLQGFLYAPAMPLPQAQAWLSDRGEGETSSD